jgi:Putative auto-transporter adhesin, head GIN domain
MLRIAAVLSSLLLLAACNWSDTYGGPTIKGSGNLKSETRVVEKFTAIVISGSANLEIEQTGEESLEITVDDNLLELFTTEVRDGTLFIGVAEGKRLSWNGKGPRIKVTVRELHKLKVSGAVSVKATKLDTDSLTISISGAGSASIAGRTDSLSISISGAGSLDAINLQAKRAIVIVSGAGDVTLNVNEELDARVSGAGSIWYVGSPRLQSRVSGAGSIKQKSVTH